MTTLSTNASQQPTTVRSNQKKMQPVKYGAESTSVKGSSASPATREYEGGQLDSGYQSDAENFTASEDSLVENRISGLLGKNSDYLKRAKSIGMRAANGRGLLNSSIASGASAAAAIDAALPIAQQDAQTHAGVDQTKQAFLSNRALSDQTAFNNSQLSAQEATQKSGSMQQEFENQSALSNQSAKQQSELSAQEAGQNSDLSYQNFLQQQTLQEMDQASREALLETQSKYNMLLQQSQAASNRFQDLAEQVAAINTNEKMKPEQKTAAIEQLYQLHNLSLETQSQLMRAAGIDSVTSGSSTGSGSTGGTSEPTAADASGVIQTDDFVARYGMTEADMQGKVSELEQRVQQLQKVIDKGGGRGVFAAMKRNVARAELEKVQKEIATYNSRLGA